MKEHEDERREYQPGYSYCGIDGGFLVTHKLVGEDGTFRLVFLDEVEETPPRSLPPDDVYWAVYNAVVEVLHHSVPARWWYTKDGRAIRHSVAGNAVQRLWDNEVHRDPGHS